MYVGLSSKQNSIIGGNVELQTGHFTESTAWDISFTNYILFANQTISYRPKTIFHIILLLK